MIFLDDDNCVMVNLDHVMVIRKKSYAYKVYTTDGDMHDLSPIKGEELMTYVRNQRRIANGNS